MKVQDLAKELNKSTKDLIKMLMDLDVRVKTGTSKLNDELVGQIRSLFAEEARIASEKKDVVVIETRVCKLNKPTIRIKELADLIAVSLSDVMRAVLNKGFLFNLNSEIDAETAKEIAAVLNVVLETEEEKKVTSTVIRDHLDKIEEEELCADPDALIGRPPVITIMGHVDHGKTLLLDTIRKTNVVEKEAGGITQHIGAYQVTVNDRILTFLDTPGHEAFTTLRARGAQVTDIAVLVVAADEGVKPQTVEAINHAKAAKVPIIVALNKMDKPGANIDMCKQQLSQYELLAEDWGGKVVMVPISAKSKQGIQELLEMIILVSDMLELKANPKCSAKGVVIESRLSRKKGPIATVLIKTGTLRVGDSFVINTGAGKVRALLNDSGEKIVAAPPGMPVEVMGIAEVPQPGSILEVMANDKTGKLLIEDRKLADDFEKHKSKRQLSMERLANQIDQGEIKQLNLIIKADVNGSLEAIVSSLNQLSKPNVTLQVAHAATGAINENDVMLACAANALIIGFNTAANPEALKLAQEEGIEIKTYSIIYEISQDVEMVLNGMFKPEKVMVEIGRAEVRQLFHFSKVGAIAGSFVTEGKLVRGAVARVYREKKEIFSGKLLSLKRFKDDVREVASGYECGIVIENMAEIKESDIVACLELQEKNKPTL